MHTSHPFRIIFPRLCRLLARSSFVLGTCVLAVACSSSSVSNSGFLGDADVYEELKPHPRFTGVRVIRTSDTPLADYDSFILPHVKVYRNTDGQGGISARSEMLELGQYFRTAVHDALENRYRITNLPGKRVGIIRLAISNAAFIPPRDRANKDSMVLASDLSQANIEVELLDSLTGRRVVAAIVDSTYTLTDDLDHLEGLKKILAGWAKIIRQRIDEDHGFIA